MLKKIKLIIREELEFLQREYSKSQSSLSKDRIKILIFIKQGKYTFQSEIAKNWIEQKKPFEVGYSNIQSLVSKN